MTEADSALHSAATSAVAAGAELLSALMEYIVPVILAAVGFFLGAQIGLSGLFANLLTGALGKNIGDTAVIWIADLVSVAIWSSIAVCLWHFSGGSMGKYPVGKWIGHSLGGLFGGFALSELGALFAGKVNYGKVSDIAASMQAGH